MLKDDGFYCENLMGFRRNKVSEANKSHFEYSFKEILYLLFTTVLFATD